MPVSFPLDAKQTLRPLRRPVVAVQIVTDKGAYVDMVFDGCFACLATESSPQLADVGGTQFWQIDPKADDGLFNAVSPHSISVQKFKRHWEDRLCLAASFKLGRVLAAGIMRTL